MYFIKDEFSVDDGRQGVSAVLNDWEGHSTTAQQEETRWSVDQVGTIIRCDSSSLNALNITESPFFYLMKTRVSFWLSCMMCI